jgi:hypothetical protein
VADVVVQGSVNFDVLINGQSSATNLGYGQATAFQAASGTSATVVYEPTGTTTQTFSTTFGIASGANDTVLALGSQTSVAPLVVAQSNGAVAGGSARLSFIHADSAQGSLDWYLTAPGSTLPSTPSLARLSYAGTSSNTAVAAPSVTVASGDWRLRAVVTADASQTVVYDSGPISLASASDALLAVVPSSGSAAPFTLFDLDANSQATWVPDQRSLLRFGQFAIGVGSVDTFLDPSGASNGNVTRVLTALAAGSASAYSAQLPGALRVSFADSGQTTEVSGLTVSVPASVARSFYLVGVNGQTGAVALTVLATADDLSAPAPGTAKVRLVNVSPDLGAIDGVLLDTSTSPATITQRWVPNLAYPGASASVSLPPGSYTVAVVPTGLATPLLPSSTGQVISATAGSITTVFVSGCRYPGNGVCPSGAQGLTLSTATN